MQDDRDHPYAAPLALPERVGGRASWATIFHAVVSSLAVFVVTVSLVTGLSVVLAVFYLRPPFRMLESPELIGSVAALACVVGAAAAISEFNRVRRKRSQES